MFDYHTISTLPPSAHLLNAIWSYKCKHTPTGEFLKYKSRICSDGSQQRHGIDYGNTYAPVVAWSTVRLILTLSSMLGLQSQQVIFTQVFTQSPIDSDVYMKIPQGWYYNANALHQHTDPMHRDTSHFIKLCKTLYGIKQAARHWYNHLHSGLLLQGFHVSHIDACLFIQDNCIILLYVDDCLLFAPDNHILDSIINQLSTTYQIGEQGSVQDFLGIRISIQPNGQIHLQQEGLIKTILSDLSLMSSVCKFMPSIHVLHPDTNGPPHQDH